MVPLEGGALDPLPLDPPPEGPVLGGGEAGADGVGGAVAALGVEGGGPYDSPALG